MAVVQLLLPALPAHVGTAGLVCVQAARRAGLPDELVDDLRLAVGEACTRAVGLHASHAPGERVNVTVTDDIAGLTVVVHDCGPAAGPAVDDVAGGLLEPAPCGGTDRAGEVVDPDVALALLTGLVDEVEVEAHPGAGTSVTLRWPLPPQRVPGASPTQVTAR